MSTSKNPWAAENSIWYNQEANKWSAENAQKEWEEIKNNNSELINELNETERAVRIKKEIEKLRKVFPNDLY